MSTKLGSEGNPDEVEVTVALKLGKLYTGYLFGKELNSDY